MVQKLKVSPIALFLVFAAVLPSNSQTTVLSGQTDTRASSTDTEILGCLDEQSGEFKLTDQNGNFYALAGRTAGLQEDVGSKLRVHGVLMYPSAASKGRSVPVTILQVTSTEVMVRANPEGLRPVLSGVDTWVSYSDPKYGVRFRYPQSFLETKEQDLHLQANFAGQEPTNAVLIRNVDIPRATYPDSSFLGGRFTVLVNPNVHSEGACKQFSWLWPEYTSLTTVEGIDYSRTLFAVAQAGMASDLYYVHTFQNGLCYEFDFDFDRNTDLPCPRVLGQADAEIMQRVLSQVSFLAPEVNGAVSEAAAAKNLRPSVISFDHSPALVDRVVTKVDVSWRTSDADYVQLRYDCVKDLYASAFNSSGELHCVKETWSNFPPDGSLSLLLDNFNPHPVQFVITIEPFRDGVGYPEESKTLSLSVDPRPPVEAQSPVQEQR